MMRIRKISGLTMVELMVSMGIGTSVLLGVLALNNTMKKVNTSANTFYQADVFRKQIVAYLKDPNSWNQTLNNNATFSCIKNFTDCASASSNGPALGPGNFNYQYTSFATGIGPCSGNTCNGGFDVYGYIPRKGGYYAFYSPASNLTAGFDMNGVQCYLNHVHGVDVPSFPGWNGQVSAGGVAYSTDPGANACPFRLVLYWVPICPNTTGTCYSPMVHVYGYTLYTPLQGSQNAVPFNATNMQINLVLPPSAATPPPSVAP